MDRFIFLGNFIKQFDEDKLTEEVNYLVDACKHVAREGFTICYEPIHDLLVYDMRLETKLTVGYNISKTYANRSFLHNSKFFPELVKLTELFGLNYDISYDDVGFVNNGVKIHMMVPGQMFPTHVDDIGYISDVDDNSSINDVVRIQVALKDWEFGQIANYGGFVYENWKAGDAFVFDWKTTQHYAVNASTEVRPFLQLTGIATEKTKEIISRGVGR
jgi:hypothetical protein